MRQPLEARDDFFGDDVADQGRDGVSVQMHPWEYRGDEAEKKACPA
jgi:hypothetical protein